ncbi:hypothetical protein H5410_025727 [Solanum commersonii]|uniref:Uncharacterized protein n=1 Tax=Solanum commersonii TaxID=4109 RepID=A0A9J5YTZ1_SOLCO|nr:hypothetical protein H5410_025727 [Solanum commersonii]
MSMWSPNNPPNGLVMSNTKLNKLCMEESDPMLKIIVRCKHENREEIDPRSQFILPKLVNKIKELEDEVWRRQIQINEQRVLIDNLTVEKRFKRTKLKWCTFDWKLTGIADALGAAGAIGGLPLAPFVCVADALGALQVVFLLTSSGPEIGAAPREPSSSKKSDSTRPETRSSASSVLGFAAVTGVVVEGDLRAAVVVGRVVVVEGDLGVEVVVRGVGVETDLIPPYPHEEHFLIKYGWGPQLHHQSSA